MPVRSGSRPELWFDRSISLVLFYGGRFLFARRAELAQMDLSTMIIMVHTLVYAVIVLAFHHVYAASPPQIIVVEVNIDSTQVLSCT